MPQSLSSRIGTFAAIVFVIICSQSLRASDASEAYSLLQDARKFERNTGMFRGIYREPVSPGSKVFVTMTTLFYRSKDGFEFKKVSIGSAERVGPPPINYITNRDGQWYNHAFLLAKIPPDFDWCVDISSRAFESQPVADVQNEYSLIPGKPDVGSRQRLVYIQRRLSDSQVTSLRKTIMQQIELARAVLGSTKAGKIPGVTDSRDIVPVRAVYKVASDLPFVFEELYYNEKGKIVARTRAFDAVQLEGELSEKDFELPSRCKIFFPKDIVAYWTTLDANER